jgi:hypothetical protein
MYYRHHIHVLQLMNALRFFDVRRLSKPANMGEVQGRVSVSFTLVMQCGVPEF